jgi:2-polyprenyl-3-methyl-5-hydroxy-6-metoxy-1,4-benzoquinol methylase
MERVLEPELMDDAEQSVAYARADFSTSNQRFVDGLIGDFPGHLHAVIDIGCGPGDVVIRLARAAPGVSITAIDGSGPMIALARESVREAGLEGRITPKQGYVPGLEPGAHTFDAVLSKDLLHHLPDPAVFWSEVMRLGRAGAAVYVMDLVRPSTHEAARRIVEAVAASESPILRQDFYNSLCAAFTIDEVRAQLAAAKLDLRVTMASDRHMLIKGLLL